MKQGTCFGLKYADDKQRENGQTDIEAWNARGGTMEQTRSLCLSYHYYVPFERKQVNTLKQLYAVIVLYEDPSTAPLQPAESEKTVAEEEEQ